jgi:2-hydroxycyclohexanecarboxyl-CoA dehydrogenase
VQVAELARQICERFAKEGASVYACDVVAPSAEAVVKQLRRESASVEPTVFDVTDPEACSAAVQEVADRHGRLDVLVNNAGVNRRGDLLTLDRADWDLSFAVNVDALFHLCRAALPIMINAGGGSSAAPRWGFGRRALPIAARSRRAAGSRTG